MTVQSIKKLLQADILTGDECLNREVFTACGSDMMSDVLAHVDDQTVLITGLCNPQVLRTAEMMDIVCVIMVRGKKAGSGDDRDGHRPEYLSAHDASADVYILRTSF